MHKNVGLFERAGAMTSNTLVLKHRKETALEMEVFIPAETTCYLITFDNCSNVWPKAASHSTASPVDLRRPSSLLQLTRRMNAACSITQMSMQCCSIRCPRVWFEMACRLQASCFRVAVSM